VTIGNCTTLQNGEGGVTIWTASDTTVASCTSRDNQDDGFDIEAAGKMAVRDSISQGNGGDGVGVTGLGAGSHPLEGNVICQNLVGVGLLADQTVHAEGNWWGFASGPYHSTNLDGEGNKVWDGTEGGQGTVDFDPWIDTIAIAAALDELEVGQTTVITFQFSNALKTVFLGQGPGNPLGTPPFELTTDNGTLTDADQAAATVQSFVNQPNGILSVTLKPAAPGKATVTLDGPCGLDSEVEVTVSGKARIYLPLVLRNH
jgi:hypothetical protein